VIRALSMGASECVLVVLGVSGVGNLESFGVCCNDRLALATGLKLIYSVAFGEYDCLEGCMCASAGARASM
jgi:hypothetical protein